LIRAIIQVFGQYVGCRIRKTGDAFDRLTVQLASEAVFLISGAVCESAAADRIIERETGCIARIQDFGARAATPAQSVG